MHLSNLLVKIFQQNIVSYLNDIRNVRPCIEVKCKKSESIGNTGKGNTVINHNKLKDMKHLNKIRWSKILS